MKLSIIISFMVIYFPLCFSQQPTDWKTYTDMKDVADLVSVQNKIWAATSGGAFSYDMSNTSYKTFHKTDGMQGVILTAVTVDNQGKIWFGSNQGVIDVYDPTTDEFNSILDIANSDFSSTAINGLSTFGDTIYVSTEFGVSSINSETLSFIDTYFRLGSFPSDIKVNCTFKSNLIYVCTDYGVAVQKTGATNLSAPESWNNYGQTDGLPSSQINKIVNFNGQIIAATSKGLSIFDGTNWNNYIADLDNQQIIDLLVENANLYILTSSKIYKYSGNTLTTIYTSSSTLTKLAYSNNVGLLAASNNGIIVIKNNELIYPNGPAKNQYTSLAVDNDSTLWVGSGTSNGVGFYKLHKNIWQNFNVSNSPSIETNNYFLTYAASDNTVYIGSWGNGFLRIKNGTFQNFNTTNTPMVGIPNNTAYLVITGFALDSDDNLWILNYGSSTNEPLSVLTKDSTWYNFLIPVQNNQYVDNQYGLIIDQYNTKWFYSTNANRPGLYYFNENGTFSDRSDDISGSITQNDGLNSSSISSLLIDREGSIWIGTSLGINIINNSGAVLTSNGVLQISSVYALRGQSINCMAVDALDRKWIGTSQGLQLVNSDGSQLIASYTTQNSPLLSNNIENISVDQNTGRVYVGTGDGITSFDTPAIKPNDSFTSLFVYPNPFIIPKENSVTIDGLIRDSQIKIVTISGRLINQFSSPGGRVASWDGKDMNGNYVNSGVYLIIAYDSEGNNIVVGKVAVLRN